MTMDRDGDDIPANPRLESGTATIQDILDRRYSRRGILGASLAFGAASSLSALAACAPFASRPQSHKTASASFHFAEIQRARSKDHKLPDDYEADILLRWGDPIFPDSPVFDPYNQSASAQEKQFGYNNDYIGFLPLEADGKRGMLFVNHEFTLASLMFPGIAPPEKETDSPVGMTAALCATERAAHGASLIEIEWKNGRWRPVLSSPRNRRITADTEFLVLAGPAAGHPRMATKADPEGRKVKGMLNNCAGGVTPWGTFLTGEENFNFYFAGNVPKGHREEENCKRYGVRGGGYAWGKFEPRFDLAQEPNEPNRFGWVVEVDPHDPAAPPRKRTALGRFKHEGAESIVAPDGRVVVYMGDDQRFDYVYKFVTAHAFDNANPSANRDLLDEGTLYAARFGEDGTLDWLPLIHGTGPLNESNGFASQADVLIETRRAADLMGATPMDRPEDIEPNPKTGRVYVMLTNNSKRKSDQLNAANPRAENKTGQIIEIVEPDGDFTATRSRWNLLVLCGNPSDEKTGATWNPATSENGWFGSPDNCAIDPQGRLWVATDGNPVTGADDGLWALETEGALRGTGRAFFRAPTGAEVCGPRFTPDGRTLFLSVQHPGDDEKSSFDDPSTRWPDFAPDMPPRPSVLAIRKKDGGVIGD